jgi:exopolysaccharide biosynthesis polyprenyl glycosylphosphotransferase
MPSDEGRFVLSLRKLQDAALTLMALAAAWWLRGALAPAQLGGLREGPEYLVVALLVVIIWSIGLEQSGAYEFSARTDFATVTVNLLKGVTVCMVILLSGLYVLKIGEQVSRLLLAEFYLIDLAALSWIRLLRVRRARREIERGGSRRNVLVVGSRQRALDVIRPVVEGRAEGLCIVGCLELDKDQVGREVFAGVRVIGTMDDFVDVLSAKAVDEVVFALPVTRIPSPDRYIARAESMGVVVRFVPEWGMYKILYAPKIARVSFEGFAGVPTLTLSSVPADRRGLFLKDVFDRVLAAVGLVVGFPLFVLIAAAIKLTDPGPVLFLQLRAGLNGRRFMMYKFRTMVENAESMRATLAASNQMDGPVFKVAGDPRVTPLGRFLRRTSLDEFPQLINVLKGEMSLVGPRPPLPSEVDSYEVWQRRRLSMKPGLTCIWQVSGRNRIGFQEWMRLDLAYIDNWSWALDLSILFKTIRVVVLAMGDNAVGQARAAREHVDDPASARASPTPLVGEGSPVVRLDGPLPRTSAGPSEAPR